MVIGEVIGIHIDDSIIADGKIDMAKLRPLARLGYYDYAVIEAAHLFSMQTPDDPRFANEE